MCVSANVSHSIYNNDYCLLFAFIISYFLHELGSDLSNGALNFGVQILLLASNFRHDQMISSKSCKVKNSSKSNFHRKFDEF